MIWAKERGATHLLTVPCDTPFLPHDLVQRLAARSRPSNARSPSRAIPIRSHPVIALWPATLATRLAADLEAGTTFRVYRWLQQFDICESRVRRCRIFPISTHQPISWPQKPGLAWQLKYFSKGILHAFHWSCAAAARRDGNTRLGGQSAAECHRRGTPGDRPAGAL